MYDHTKFDPKSPEIDPAKDISQEDHTMADDGRAAAWDIFHSSADHLSLAQKIQHLEMLKETRHRLFEAKQATAPTVDPVHEVRKAIESVSQIDPATLEVAEKHPAVLQ
jgi:hypothetical protein